MNVGPQSGWWTPTSYSKLFLAAWKLERLAEARDPLLRKTTTAGRLNMTHSQTPGSVFPSWKLKGNCSFTAQSTTVENNKAEEDSGAKAEGEEEADCSARDDVETSGGVGGADQSVWYIVQFANVVVLYQKKNWNCFRFASPDHLVRDCLKDLSKTAWKVSLNAKEGTTKKGCWVPQKPVIAKLASPKEAPWA